MFLTTAIQGSFLILLTSFGPFNQVKQNQSERLAQELIALSDMRFPEDRIEVEHCSLPVVFDQAAQSAMECIKKLPRQPDLVLSLGQGDTCQLRLEVLASNLDRRDQLSNNEQLRQLSQEIVPGADKKMGFRFPLIQSYCEIQNRPSYVVISPTTGSYVCNNTAYHLERILRPQEIPYTFIHVPSQSCGNKINQQDVLRVIYETLKVASAIPKEHWHPLPTSMSKAKEAAYLNEHNACYKNTYRQLSRIL